MTIKRKLLFHSLALAIVLCAASHFGEAQPGKNSNQTSSSQSNQNNNQRSSEASEHEAMEKRVEQRFNQMETRIQNENQMFSDNANRHILLATVFVGVATLFVVGVTIYTGYLASRSTAEFRQYSKDLRQEFKESAGEYKVELQTSRQDFLNTMQRLESGFNTTLANQGKSANDLRVDFKDTLDRLERSFNTTLASQTHQFQSELNNFRTEVQKLDAENREQTGELKETATRLEDFSRRMERDFSTMQDEFNKMRGEHRPAQEILRQVYELTNSIRDSYEDPETLRQKALLEVVALLLDNPNFPEEFQRRLRNELIRLSGVANLSGSHVHPMKAMEEPPNEQGNLPPGKNESEESKE